MRCMVDGRCRCGSAEHRGALSRLAKQERISLPSSRSPSPSPQHTPPLSSSLSSPHHLSPPAHTPPSNCTRLHRPRIIDRSEYAPRMHQLQPAPFLPLADTSPARTRSRRCLSPSRPSLLFRALAEMVSPLVKHKIVKKRRKTFPRHYSDRFERLNYGSWRKPKGQHPSTHQRTYISVRRTAGSDRCTCIRIVALYPRHDGRRASSPPRLRISCVLHSFASPRLAMSASVPSLGSARVSFLPTSQPMSTSTLSMCTARCTVQCGEAPTFVPSFPAPPLRNRRLPRSSLPTPAAALNTSPFR